MRSTSENSNRVPSKASKKLKAYDRFDNLFLHPSRDWTELIYQINKQ